MKNVKISKAEALAKFLDCEVDDINETNYCFELGNQEYLVLTDAEADEKAKESILETAWKFNKSFLDVYSEAISEIDEKTFSVLQESGKSSNKAIIAMLDSENEFVDDVICLDGRGRFLAGYDGEEKEQDGYYIYRIN